MDVYVVYRSKIKIGDGLELFSYEENASERTIKLEDEKNRRRVTIIDRGLDGMLDEVGFGYYDHYDEQIPTTPEWKAIYDESVKEVGTRLPGYLKEIESLQHSQSLPETWLDIARGTTSNFQYKILGKDRTFSFSGTGDGMANFDPVSLGIIDKETGLSVSIESPSVAKQIRGAYDLLESVRQLVRSYFEKSSDRRRLELSGAFFLFSRSETVDEWDGVKNRDGKPSELDEELARALFDAPDIGTDDYGKYGLYRELRPDDLIAILKRYKGPKDVLKLKEFLLNEHGGAGNISSKLKDVTPPIRNVKEWRTPLELGVVSIDIWGRLHSKVFELALGQDAMQPGYIFDAIDELVRKYSGEKYHLRERTLHYLDNSLYVRPLPHGKALVFRDKNQNPENDIVIPQDEIMTLILGKPDSCRGVSIDGFYICDRNEDGRINSFADIIQKKGKNVLGERTFERSTADELLKSLAKKFPPPFTGEDLKMSEQGVALTKLRKWADTVNHALVKPWKFSPDPMSDGKYRALIYRSARDSDISTDSIWFSFFVWMNGFDDVYVVPPLWGTEIALNEIAARNLPIDHLYIGSHSDQFEFGDIPLDFDRTLKFADGGTATFTGCNTTPAQATVLGAQIFKNSKGTLIWGDGLNFPTPFLGILSTGDVHHTDFDHEARVEPPDGASDVRKLVDPIPGGLF